MELLGGAPRVPAPGLAYFHTSYLFHPFGTTIANHPHTALPAIVAATLLGQASIVTAQNLLLLAYVFANMAAMYALVWDIGRDRRAAVLGAVIFGLSPYLASHLLGHFDLMAAFVLPLFALFVRRAMRAGSMAWTTAAGVVLIATAYTTYYYVVYLFFFLAVYSIASLDWRPVRWSPRTPSPGARRLRYALSALIAGLAAAALWMVLTGGRTLTVGGLAVPMHKPQNALTGVWICAIVYALSLRRPALTHAPMPRGQARRIAMVATGVAGLFVIGAAPLFWQALQLIVRGEYVSQEYGWRSVPRGVDLLAPLLGHPLHPLMAAASGPAYAALGQNTVEAVGWLGIVPIALLLLTPARESWRRRTRSQSLARRGDRVRDLRARPVSHDRRLRHRPQAAGDRAALRAVRGERAHARARDRRRLPGARCAGRDVAAGLDRPSAIAGGPVAADRPGRVRILGRADPPHAAAASRRVQRARRGAPGAVCEVPFGVGDGLSVGVGSQERVILYYATLHEHPLAGGYIGRMPADAAERYRRHPLTAALLRLSGDTMAAPPSSGPEPAPCQISRGGSSIQLVRIIGLCREAAHEPHRIR